MGFLLCQELTALCTVFKVLTDGCCRQTFSPCVHPWPHRSANEAAKQGKCVSYMSAHVLLVDGLCLQDNVSPNHCRKAITTCTMPNLVSETSGCEALTHFDYGNALGNTHARRACRRYCTHSSEASYRCRSKLAHLHEVKTWLAEPQGSADGRALLDLQAV